MHRRYGFTLIELLVVVAIIVALLAILLPSMGRAVYTAQLAVCASNLREIALGAFNYATDHTGAYPHRPTWALKAGSKPNNIMFGTLDDRPIIEDYIDLNGVINCPLGEKVDWVGTNPASGMEAPYNLFFGYGYKTAGNTAMLRVQQRWTWGGRQFSVIASDRDVVHLTGDYVHGSHPDRDGVMWAEALGTGGAANVGGNFTLFRWINYDQSDRGRVDLNNAFDDGSVLMINNAEVADDRLAPVPEFSDGGGFPTAPTYVFAPF